MSDTDKRKVSTDALETLGTIIGPDEKRDAIHLAVIPVQAGQWLMVGADVGIGPDGKAWNGRGLKQIGIVDPFLSDGPQQGEWFWLVIYPRQITSLRHVWTHPDVREDNTVTEALPVEPDIATSERWIREYLANEDNDCPSYERLLEAVQRNDDSEYLYVRDESSHGRISPELWEHLEIVLGTHIPGDRRPQYFTCSC